MKLGELIKGQGIDLPKKEEALLPRTPAPPTSRRRFFWDGEQQQDFVAIQPVGDKVEPNIGRDQPAAVWGASTTEPDQSEFYPPAPVEPGLSLETGNKVATNRQQSGDRIGNKVATNRQQSGDAANARVLSKAETGNKVATELATNWQQSENKPTTKATFAGLVGLQRAVLILIYDACKAARGRVSEPLTLEHLANCLKTSHGSVKTTLQRLEAKSCILRATFKNGRGGWSRYELPEAIFRELLQLETENKLATKWQQTENKLVTQPATSPPVVVVSSSVDLKNNNDGEASLRIPDEVRALGLTPKSFLRCALPIEELQASLEAFAVDLRNKKVRAKSSPQALLLGVLKSGGPYISADYAAAVAQDVVEVKKRVEVVSALRREQVELESLIAFEHFRRVTPEEKLIEVVPRSEAVPLSIWERLVKQAFLDGRFNERKDPLEKN